MNRTQFAIIETDSFWLVVARAFFCRIAAHPQLHHRETKRSHCAGTSPRMANTTSIGADAENGGNGSGSRLPAQKRRGGAANTNADANPDPDVSQRARRPLQQASRVTASHSDQRQRSTRAVLDPSAPAFEPAQSSSGVSSSRPAPAAYVPSVARVPRAAPLQHDQQRQQQRQRQQGLNAQNVPSAGSSAGTSASAGGRGGRRRTPNQQGRNTVQSTQKQRSSSIHTVDTTATDATTDSGLSAENSSLSQRMEHALRKGSYECMVCYERVRHKDAIWSCSKSCFAVFHAKCIRVWAQSAFASGASSSTPPPPLNQRPEWRCPGCQYKYAAAPYPSCFCGKVDLPRGSMNSIPHSCGNQCRRDRKCSHKCVSVCHPGPCEKCDLVAPDVECFCGKVVLRFRCAEVEESMDLSCRQVCGKLLDCGKHSCEKPCHDGSCWTCPIQVERDCECGKCTTLVACAADTRNEIFECDEPCGFEFPCGVHSCENGCHEHDITALCPSDPSNVESCPCGATTIEELLGKQRKNCEEQIPVCDNTCAKLLKCGHICTAPCHTGECAPCSFKVTLPCRCGLKVFSLECKDIALDDDGRYQVQLCERVCTKKRSCQKHQCGNVCCPADAGAHYCEQQCAKLLKCGQHRCQMACGHADRCHDCFEGVSFEELACACGSEVIYPPIPCGTKPPRCNQPCRLEQPCGHVAYSTHPCHPVSEPCPKCMIFGERSCCCGKTVMKNVPCSRTTSPSCGAPCEKIVDGCMHVCKRPCHTGECTDATNKCSERCNRVRAICGHVCAYPCHGKNHCSEDKPCKQMVRETCPCGLRSAEFPCNAWKESAGRNAGSAHLQCDNSCALSKRNRALADALEITAEGVASAATAATGSLQGDLDPLETRLSLIKHAHLNLVWARGVEKVLADFVADPLRKLHHMPGGKLASIKFVLGVAPYYGLEAEVVDAHWGKPSLLLRKKRVCGVPNTLVSTLAPQYRALEAAAKTITASVGSNTHVNTLSLALSEEYGEDEEAEVAISSSFSVSLLQEVNVDSKRIQAIVLAPTRALVTEICGLVTFAFEHHTTFECLAAVDKSSVKNYSLKMQEGVQVVVGTPGCMFQLIQEENVVSTLEEVKLLVLDAVDDLTAEKWNTGKWFVKRQISRLFKSLPVGVDVVPLSKIVAQSALHSAIKFLHDGGDDSKAPEVESKTPINGFHFTKLNQSLDEVDVKQKVEKVIGTSADVTWIFEEGTPDCVVQLRDDMSEVDLESKLVAVADDVYETFVLGGFAEDVKLCWITAKHEVTSSVDVPCKARDAKLANAMPVAPKRSEFVELGQKSAFAALSGLGEEDA